MVECSYCGSDATRHENLAVLEDDETNRSSEGDGDREQQDGAEDGRECAGHAPGWGGIVFESQPAVALTGIRAERTPSSVSTRTVVSPRVSMVQSVPSDPVVPTKVPST